MKKMHNSIPSNTNHYQIKIQSWLFLCKEDSDHTHSNLFKITAPKSIRCKGNKKTKHCINDKENNYRKAAIYLQYKSSFLYPDNLLYKLIKPVFNSLP